METIVNPQTESSTPLEEAVHTRFGKLPSWLGWLFVPLATAIIIFCATWIQIENQLFTYRFFWVESFWWHRAAWFAGWVFLMLVYLFLLGLSNRHVVATIGTSILLCIPAIICYYKLAIHGEPFLPWDLAQASEAFDIAGKAGLWISKPMVGSAIILVALTLLSCLLQNPKFTWKHWLARTLIPCAGVLFMIFGVFLQENVTKNILYISPDAWMQDRYYRNYGLITAFFTNIQVMQIDAPDNYNPGYVQSVLDGVEKSPDSEPYFAASYAAQNPTVPEKTPTIIYIQSEAFWDPTDLPGVTFDQPLTPNIQRTRQEMAFGKCFSPRFGGGTCDVECEVLTGFSMEYLPNNCKPYVEYIHGPMSSIAAFHKTQGYQTKAIHGYYAKFWNRERTYANLGFDDFISLEDMDNPERKRPIDWEDGLVSEDEMARQIIDAYESKQDGPLFLHAVTIENHLAYAKENFSDVERVRVTSAPEGVTEYTIGCLEDFATGVQDTDKMWGTLTDYFDKVDEPVIMVMWGDHYNPIGNGMNVYSATGYSSEDAKDPRVHGTPLLIWSNYHKEAIDLGTVAAYQVTPITNDLYGLEQPAYFDLLRQEFDLYRAKSVGTIVEPDNTYHQGALTPEQQEFYDKHWLLQYDMLFGKNYQNAPIFVKQTG